MPHKFKVLGIKALTHETDQASVKATIDIFDK
ncbi:MAG: hypothetical protein ACI9LX_001636 [Paraglaciecola sp.]|jgi:hypothetical protein